MGHSQVQLLELRNLVLQNVTEEDRKGEHQHQNDRNSQSDTTFIPFQSTPAINQGTLIHIRIMFHNIWISRKCMNFM
jgi:hypothetical protein